MPRVAAYLRVSSDDQAERGTIENQAEFASKYADLHGLEISAWYRDDGVTGTLPLEERPAGRQLLEDARAGKFDLLLLYRLDRLGRSARIILNAVYELEQHGVTVRSMTEPFDTGDPSGRFLLTILAGVADLERETILERMSLGANRAAREGKWLGGIVPYGYRKNAQGYLEINEDPLPGLDLTEASVVRLIYHLIADQGFSTIKVADYLNALGVPPAYAKDHRQVLRGKRKVNTAGIWRPGRIRNMVISTTYKGLHHYGKRTSKKRELIARPVPAIVGEETWAKAQQVLRNNQIEAARNAKRHYLLRGLIKCGICGLTYQGTAYKGPGEKLKGYYVCGGKVPYRGRLNGRCPSKNVPQAWLEALVWHDCVDFITNPGQAVELLTANMKQQQAHKAGLLAEREALLRALQGKEFERQTILDLYRRHIITSSDVEQQMQSITREEAALRQRAEDLDRQLEAEENLASQVSTAEELLADLRSKIQGDVPFPVKREVVKALVKEIVVHTEFEEGNARPRARVVIRYAFSPSNGVHCTLNRADNTLGNAIVDRELRMPAWPYVAPTDGDSLGSRLRRARIAAGISVAELARITRLSTVSIHNFESDRNRPAPATLQRLSKALGVSADYLSDVLHGG